MRARFLQYRRGEPVNRQNFLAGFLCEMMRQALLSLRSKEPHDRWRYSSVVKLASGEQRSRMKKAVSTDNRSRAPFSTRN